MIKRILLIIALIILIVSSAFWYQGNESLSFFSDYFDVELMFEEKNEKTAVVGVIYMSGSYELAFEGMKDMLTGLGFEERRTVVFEKRVVSSSNEEIQRAVKELVDIKPDLIYTISTPITQSVYQIAGNKIPVVFNIVGDPIGPGFAESYSKPGKNITGCSNLSAELSGKRLEVFMDAIPSVNKVVSYYNPDNAFSQLAIENTRQAAQKLGLQVDEVQVHDRLELQEAIARMSPADYQGINVLPDAMVVSNIDLVISKAREGSLPILAHEATLAEKGVTITYGASFYELGRQCAFTVQNILDGQSPAVIPIQTPGDLQIVVNMRSAAQAGVTIRPDFLARVDKIIR